MSLGLSANLLNGYFKDQTSFIRLNHYPPCPFPHLALGVGHHKDAGGLTVLAQDDVGGLEVRRKSDREWIPVKPTPDAYIINVGDIIQVPLISEHFARCCHHLKLCLSLSVLDNLFHSIRELERISIGYICLYRFGAMKSMRVWSTGWW